MPANSIKGFKVGNEVKKYDYNELDNLPENNPDDLAEQIGDLKSDIDNIDTITIENYERELDTIQPEASDIHDNQAFTVNVEWITLQGWEGIVLRDLEPGKTYYISGSNATQVRLYCISKTDGTFEFYPSGSGTITDLPVVMPDNYRALYVNANKANVRASVKEHTYNFKLIPDEITPIAEETSENHYSINSKNGFVNDVVLNGSANGLFNFGQLKLNTSAYKIETDDITPVYLSGDVSGENIGYVGANHGYALAYEYTFNGGHGLTTADIGKVYTAPNGYKYVLIRVISSTKLIIGFYSSNLWYKVRPILYSTSFDFGNGTIVSDSHSNAPVQLYPSVKNGIVRIVENSAECCKIEETYDIIDIGSGIEAIIANVGANDNDSFCTLADVGLTVRNLYEFINNGSVTVYQNLKVCKDYIKLNRYGGLQSMAFSTGDYYSVPQTSVKQPIAIPSAGATFDRETWDDQSIPPMLYMQFNENLGTATKAFATGFIAGGRNALLSSTAGSVSNAKKMYPAFVQPVSVFPTGKVFNTVSFRVPFIPGEYSNQIKLVSYFKAYGDYYLIIITNVAINTSVILPDILCNRKAQVVMSDGIECDTVDIINSVDVKSTGVGYLVLKLNK